MIQYPKYCEVKQLHLRKQPITIVWVWTNAPFIHHIKVVSTVCFTPHSEIVTDMERLSFINVHLHHIQRKWQNTLQYLSAKKKSSHNGNYMNAYLTILESVSWYCTHGYLPSCFNFAHTSQNNIKMKGLVNICFTQIHNSNFLRWAKLGAFFFKWRENVQIYVVLMWVSVRCIWFRKCLFITR